MTEETQNCARITKRKIDVNPKYQCKPNLRKNELLHDEAAAAGWSVDPGLGEVTGDNKCLAVCYHKQIKPSRSTNFN